jgi:farnesyl diphosphate synthase
MHRLKTGALLLCSVELGASCGVAVSANTHVALARFGQALGLAFQVVDDILDVTADSATLGKTAGKDAAADKPTYVALMGLQAAQRHADELAQEALQALHDTGLNDSALQPLKALTAMVVQRQH